MDDLISKEEALNEIYKLRRNFIISPHDETLLIQFIKNRPVVAIPSAELKKCKDCKWWRDSDGAYRRGVKAESKCPINTVSVANGWGYCYMFESQERSEE